MLNAEDDRYIGRSFGSYRIVRRIARGGQSSIFEATNGTQRVAIKVLHADRERTPETRLRLRREAIAMRRLQHPNVVRLLDQGDTADGDPWLAMEFLEGESLARRIARIGTLAEAEVLAIMKPICAALSEAHHKGIIHRDLKPQNIMLVPHGAECTPKLLDFGIAALADANSVTSSITVSGTAMYMAPEQWGGLKNADERSDVYALGMIIYQALSGRCAFEADTPLACMTKVRSEAPLDLTAAMGARPVTPAVRAAVMKALARDPSHRPQTPMELWRALQPPPPSANGEIKQRRWTRIAAVGILGSVLASGGGYYLGKLRRTAAAGASGPPLVILMDTLVPRGVYDAEAVARGATNADTLSDLLHDLPITTEKETLPSTWNREAQVLARKPDLIVIHRSAFFHALNFEFGFGYEPFADDVTKERWALLYRTADDKLITFMGLVAIASPRTKFLVYSRGTGSAGKGWTDPDHRRYWVDAVVRRFPALKQRITTFAIEGGVQRGSFKNPVVTHQLRQTLLAVVERPAN
jgi:tRNA A-37 threonylcarbamoyl transferase component Bud32